MNRIIRYKGFNFTIEHRVKDGKIVATVGQVGENNIFADDVQLSPDGYGYVIEAGRHVTAEELVWECAKHYFKIMEPQWAADRAERLAGGIDEAI